MDDRLVEKLKQWLQTNIECRKEDLAGTTAAHMLAPVDIAGRIAAYENVLRIIRLIENGELD